MSEIRAAALAWLAGFGAEADSGGGGWVYSEPGFEMNDVGVISLSSAGIRAVRDRGLIARGDGLRCLTLPPCFIGYHEPD